MNGRVLCFVRVFFTCINLEFAELDATKAGFRDHPPNCLLDEKNRTALAEFLRILDFLTTNVSGETGVNLVGLFRASEDNVLCIDHYDEIASINVGSKSRLIFATQQTRGFHGYLAEDFAFGVDHIPFAFDFMWLGGKCLHFSNREILQRGAIERTHPQGRGT